MVRPACCSRVRTCMCVRMRAYGCLCVVCERMRLPVSLHAVLYLACCVRCMCFVAMRCWTACFASNARCTLCVARIAPLCSLLLQSGLAASLGFFVFPALEARHLTTVMGGICIVFAATGTTIADKGTDNAGGGRNHAEKSTSNARNGTNAANSNRRVRSASRARR